MEKIKKFLSFSGFEFFLKSLNLKVKFIFFILSLLFFSSLSFLLVNFYIKSTKSVPKEGGELILGEIGHPSLLNPIYSPFSDVEETIVGLLFSGLMKYEDGRIIPDLAQNYEILENGKIFEFILKENIFWSDGNPITSDDVIFTVKTIQNPEIKSPLRTTWLGVETEKISDRSLRFILKNPSATFLENCTLKIIPKHVWENVLPNNFFWHSLNLEPISSGPYKLEKIERDKEGKITSLSLIKDEKYFGKKPFIERISLLFFENENQIIEMAKKRKIDGFSLNKPLEIFGFKMLKYKVPRYFAVFFNLENKIFSKEVREAINYGTNKEEILKNVFLGQGKIINSPILPEIFGFKKNEKYFTFDQKKAEEILKKAGFEDYDGDGIKEKIVKKEPSFQFKSDLKLNSKGKEVEELQKCLARDSQIYPDGEITGYFGQKTKEAVIKFQEKYKEEILKPLGLSEGTGEVKGKTREKLNEICFERKEEKIPLKFSLVTVEQPHLVKMAEILKKEWKDLGIEVEVKEMKIEDLKREIIPKKDYDAILFGQILGAIVDPFPFWHSSQRGEGGLNLSNYEKKDVDKILEETKKILDEEKRKENLEKFQDLLISDVPAVFLINVDYLYLLSEKVKGERTGILFTMREKFSNIDQWYLKTKRVLK